MSRVLLCHLGTQTDPVSHITQGAARLKDPISTAIEVRSDAHFPPQSTKVQLSLKEHIEKNSPVLGRNAQYEKTSSIASLPPFLVVHTLVI